MKRILLLITLFSLFNCYEFDLEVINDGAALRRSANHKSRVRKKLKAGTILIKKKKVFHWYETVYTSEKNKKIRGFIYRDDVKRVHHNRNIYTRQFREKDSLALMLTWPVIFILVGILIASSRKKTFNTVILLFFIFILLVQTVYVLALDRASFQRRNVGFRIMINHINEIRKQKRKMFIYFTDYTWPARIEVLSDFGMNYDRFSKNRKYNSRARMHYLTDKSNLGSMRGRYIITDPYYYNLVKATGWNLPAGFYEKSYPANWVLVKKTGSARLYYAR